MLYIVSIAGAYYLVRAFVDLVEWIGGGGNCE